MRVRAWRTRLRWAGLILLLGSVLATFPGDGRHALVRLVFGPPAGATLLALSLFVGRLRSRGVPRLGLLIATGGAIGAINSLLSACVVIGFFFLRDGEYDWLSIEVLLSVAWETAPWTAGFGLIAGFWISFLPACPPGFCQRCGYDLRGTAGRCPECGRAFDASNPRIYTTTRWREALVIFLIVCVCALLSVATSLLAFPAID